MHLKFYPNVDAFCSELPGLGGRRGFRSSGQFKLGSPMTPHGADTVDDPGDRPIVTHRITIDIGPN